MKSLGNRSDKLLAPEVWRAEEVRAPPGFHRGNLTCSLSNSGEYFRGIGDDSGEYFRGIGDEQAP